MKIKNVVLSSVIVAMLALSAEYASAESGVGCDFMWSTWQNNKNCDYTGENSSGNSEVNCYYESGFVVFTQNWNTGSCTVEKYMAH